MSLKLGQRTCQIGPSINSRTQKAGQNDVPALDIPLSQIVIDSNNLDALLLEEGAWDRLFIEPVDNKPIAPVFPLLAPLRFREKIGNVNLTLIIGSHQLALEKVTLASVTLELQEGGMCHLSFTLQCLTEQVGDDLRVLVEHQNKQVLLELHANNYGAPAEEKPKKTKQIDLVDGPLDAPKQPKKRGRPAKRKPMPVTDAPTGSDGEGWAP